MSAKIDANFVELTKRLDSFEISMKKYATDFSSLFSEQTVRIVTDLCRLFQTTLNTTVKLNFEAISANLNKFACDLQHLNSDKQLTEDILATNTTVLSGS